MNSLQASVKNMLKMPIEGIYVRRFSSLMCDNNFFLPITLYLIKRKALMCPTLLSIRYLRILSFMICGKRSSLLTSVTLSWRAPKQLSPCCR